MDDIIHQNLCNILNQLVKSNMLVSIFLKKQSTKQLSTFLIIILAVTSANIKMRKNQILQNDQYNSLVNVIPMLAMLYDKITLIHSWEYFQTSNCRPVNIKKSQIFA